MSEHLVVLTSFWASFILSILIMLYAIKLYRRMDSSGLLTNTTIYIGLSALLFGIHHISEIYFENAPGVLAIAESLEGIATILLGMAVYQLYKLA